MSVKNVGVPLSMCAGALLGLLIGAASLHAATINILALGDSITNNGYYISPLETLLDNAGDKATLIANEGQRGYVIAHQYTINGTTYTSASSGLLDNISTYLNHPGMDSSDSYILLMIGTNNVNTGFDLADYDVQYRMDLLISAIQKIAPLSHLVVAQIVPNCGSVALNQAVQRFNVNVGAAVATAQATWPNVSLVDMYPPFNPTQYYPYTSTDSPYYYDNDLHPNQAGGNLMAQVWYNGILAVPVPEPSSLALLAAGGLALAAWIWRRRR